MNLDGRSCSEKIVGPLCDDNSTQPIQFREADENNTLTLRCRVICQEDGAYYTPYIRLITSEGDKIYDLGSNSSPSNDSNSSPSNDTCDTENHIQDYEFHLAALNETLNGSIAMCGVFYQSRFENFTENCSTSTVVWITLKPPPPMAVTIPPTNSSKVEAETGSSAEQYCIPKIPEGVAIVFIVLAIILCLVVTGLALIGAIYVYKKFCKKNSVHAETDKSTVKENDSAIKCQAQGH